MAFFHVDRFKTFQKKEENTKFHFVLQRGHDVREQRAPPLLRVVNGHDQRQPLPARPQLGDEHPRLLPPQLQVQGGVRQDRQGVDGLDQAVRVLLHVRS